MTIDGRKFSRFIFIVLTIAWLVFIFWNSSQTSDVSSAKSMAILKWISSILDSVNLPNFVSEFILRKAGHLFEFTILGTLLGGIVFTSTRKLWARLLVPFGAGVVVAIADEVLQLFISGRSGEIRDVCIDAIGVALGIIISQIICVPVHRMCNRKIGRHCA